MRRLWCEGPLPTPDPGEMRTVRSLVRRGLLRTRDRGRDRASEPGCWFLTARAVRLVSQAEGVAPGALAKPNDKPNDALLAGQRQSEEA